MELYAPYLPGPLDDGRTSEGHHVVPNAAGDRPEDASRATAKCQRARHGQLDPIERVASACGYAISLTKFLAGDDEVVMETFN